MDRPKNYIIHYQSQYYDPVKAHEYYMRNRQLKGRPTSSMSDQQKEAWAYSKDQITTEKKSKVESQEQDRDQKIEQFRALAEETRKRISDKLKQLSKQLSDKAEAERDKIEAITKAKLSDIDSKAKDDIDKIEAKTKDKLDDIEAKRKAKIEGLPPIPKNLPTHLRVKMMEERKKEIADINESASKDKDSLRESSKNEKEAIRETASADKEAVRNASRAGKELISEQSKKDRADAQDSASVDRENARQILKSTIAGAREAYKKVKAELDANYEQTYQDEYEKVVTNIQGKVKKKRGKR